MKAAERRKIAGLKRFLIRCAQCSEEVWHERDPRASKFRSFCPACGSIALDVVRDIWAEIRLAKEDRAREEELIAEKAAEEAIFLGPKGRRGDGEARPGASSPHGSHEDPTAPP